MSVQTNMVHKLPHMGLQNERCTYAVCTADGYKELQGPL